MVLSGRQNWSRNSGKFLMPSKVTRIQVEGLIVLLAMDIGSWVCHRPHSGRVESHTA